MSSIKALRRKNGYRLKLNANLKRKPRKTFNFEVQKDFFFSKDEKSNNPEISEKSEVEKKKIQNKSISSQSSIETVKINKISQKLKEPKISIIVPVYNVENYIEECINSLINQTYKNIEIMIINDCSTDSTGQIISQLGDKYPNLIKIYNNRKNVGTYISINIGIKLTNGKYITIIGGDDIFTPEKIITQVQILEKNEKYVACYCNYERYHWETGKILITNYGESTIMFRRKVIYEIGYYDSVRFGADTEFKDRIKKFYGPYKTKIINKTMYKAKYRPHSLTTSKTSKSGCSARSTYAKNYNFWHLCTEKTKLKMPFPLKRRPFKIPIELIQKP